MPIRYNNGLRHLKENYIFSEIAQRVATLRSLEPSKEIISLGIGDVTLPLAPSVAQEMARASLELGSADTFCGYGDTQGLYALRSAICAYYAERGASLDESEIFVNDGAKGDLGNLLELFGENEVLICDPTYPVYVEASEIFGKSVRLLKLAEDNGFAPSPDSLPLKPFVIYLCSPNNPTGIALDRKNLEKWVDFALNSGSVIIFDAAYEGYITDANLPHSIFEIDGARWCAIEVCSLSKGAGFTGVRCGWCAISKKFEAHKIWKRRVGARFNGASLVAQRGALAALSKKGRAESAKNIAQYMKNARILADVLSKKNIFYTGGINAPYLWLRCPVGMSSWELFDRLLTRYGIVGTPGVGFGEGGEGYFRLCSFTPHKDVLTAAERLDLAL